MNKKEGRLLVKYMDYLILKVERRQRMSAVIYKYIGGYRVLTNAMVYATIETQRLCDVVPITIRDNRPTKEQRRSWRKHK